jgi:hypothetical protein
MANTRMDVLAGGEAIEVSGVAYGMPIRGLVVIPLGRRSSPLKRRLAAVAVVASLVGAAPAVAPALDGSPVAPASAVAKSCSTGWTHAIINAAHKCLRRGQFCSRSSDPQYHRYGFHCHTGRLR